MKTYLLMIVAALLLSKNADSQIHFGPASQQTWDHIQEANSDIDLAQGLGGLAAAYNLVITDPGVEGAVQAATTDGDDYTNTSDFIHAFDAIRAGAIRDAVDLLLANDEMDGRTLLTDEERAFWNAFRETLSSGGTGSSSSAGEPHITTFDGYHYDLQTVGEFLLSKSTLNNFEIQVRQKAWSGNVSANSAVAMNVHGMHVSFYASDFPDKSQSTPLYINGQPYTMHSTFVKFKKGGAIQQTTDNGYVVYWETGEKAGVTISGYIDIALTVPRHEKSGLIGLMGNNDANEANDLKTSDGLPLEIHSWASEALQYVNFGKGDRLFGSSEKIFNEMIAKKFANSWRITESNSLFQYPPGQTTSNFTDKAFPLSFNSVSDLTPEQVARARRTCQRAGVTDNNMQACVYDVAFTGQNVFAKSNAFLEKTQEILQSAGVNTPLNKVEDTKSRLKQQVKNRILHY